MYFFLLNSHDCLLWEDNHENSLFGCLNRQLGSFCRLQAVDMYT